jgi:hypothetical protein
MKNISLMKVGSPNPGTLKGAATTGLPEGDTQKHRKALGGTAYDFRVK